MNSGKFFIAILVVSTILFGALVSAYNEGEETREEINTILKVYQEKK